ncbi:MAG: hypothetical protein FGM14_14800 [Flavobacteriales bacterium]|nr:hypothetical protein [Flavobacteriales bacterium]
MNIFPKNVLVGKRKDGSKFTIEEYDYNTYAGLQSIDNIATLVCICLIAMIVSPILLLIVLLQFAGRFHIGFIICIVFSGYFVLDCYKGWILSSVLNIFVEGPVLSFFVKMNIACIGLSLYYLLFGNVTFQTVLESTNIIFFRYILFFGYTLLLGFILYAFSGKFISDNWVSENINKKSEVENEITSDSVTEHNVDRNERSYSSDTYDYNYDSDYYADEVYAEPTQSTIRTFEIGERIDGGIVVELDETGSHGIIMYSLNRLQNYNEAANTLSKNNLRLPTIQELVRFSKNRNLFNELEISDRATFFWTSSLPVTEELNSGFSKHYYSNFENRQTNENQVSFVKCLNPFTDELKLVDDRMLGNSIGLKEF